MSKIAFFNVPAFGHISPTLQVVEDLVNKGYEIDYYDTERFQDVITPTGANFCEIPMFAQYEQHPAKTLLHVLTLIAKQTYYYLPLVVDAIRKERYAAVVHDQLCLWARGACSITRTPAICSFTMLPLTAAMKRGFASPRDLIRTAMLGGPTFLRFIYYRRRLREDFGLRDLSPFDVLSNYSKFLTIVFTSREIVPGASEFDDSYSFVGASLRPSSVESGILEHLPNGRRLVYISLGTIVDDAKSFYRMCGEALKGIDAQVVMSIGRKVKKEDLGNFPDNFYVTEFVPQLELLKRTHVFISHGGMNSITESLYHGVPLILCPQTPEQKFNARVIGQSGAATYLKRSEMHAEVMKNAVETLLSDVKIRERARILGESLRNSGGPQRAAEQIANIAESVGTRSAFGS